MERKGRHWKRKALPSALSITHDEAILTGSTFSSDLLSTQEVWHVFQGRGT